MAAEPLHEICTPYDDACLRSAEQLVSGKADKVGAGGQTCARSGLVADVDERAGTEIVHERQPVTTGNLSQLGQRSLRSEAHDAEGRLVHAQKHCRLRADRSFVVVGARAVRRPDLA